MTAAHAHRHTQKHRGGEGRSSTICNCIYIEATASVAVMLYAKMHFRAQINIQNWR